MTQGSQQNKKQITRSSPLEIKLPYLKNSKTILLYENSERKKAISLFPNFDLSLNHCTMPHYNPQQDKNLVFFFQKPHNRKRIMDIKELEKRKHRVKQSPSSSHRPQEAKNNAKRYTQLSRNDFMSYIEQMKAKITSQDRQLK